MRNACGGEYAAAAVTAGGSCRGRVAAVSGVAHVHASALGVKGLEIVIRHESSSCTRRHVAPLHVVLAVGRRVTNC